MDHTFCPGSKLLRQPAPEFFDCPYCGTETEIWTDELRRNCPSCHRPVYRDSTMSCLDWCKRGKECVGEAAYEKHVENRCMGLKESLLTRVRDHLGANKATADRAVEVAEKAELILRSEEAEWNIVVPASILCEVGADDASPTANDIVKDILFRLGLKMEDITSIRDLVAARHTNTALDNPNFRVFHDANLLVDLSTDPGAATEDRFLTAVGREMAQRTLAVQVETGSA